MYTSWFQLKTAAHNTGYPVQIIFLYLCRSCKRKRTKPVFLRCYPLPQNAAIQTVPGSVLTQYCQLWY